MTPNERYAILSEARSWLRTPYRSNASVRGAGADCAMFPLAVYGAVLSLPAIPLPTYQAQWHMHNREELYLNHVRALGAHAIAEPEPGDFALWRFGRCYSHGAIILEWPNVIHALNPRGVVLANAHFDSPLTRRNAPLFFTF